ncbi:RCC1/BLIP-II [Tilletiopsis washingtonensis]|uniref:RCC1/BLIP-II n=1 Tax=Tilletiopsis washingtonensis TaxID=58919 RepID=A0A316Z3B2_9BASI|nr:RCC1/BLIP-II [Tilletiopsis washingtonensis]PWN95448.1 RCC1/BLIP-II [Tilletiopsis washingtonensis]
MASAEAGPSSSSTAGSRRLHQLLVAGSNARSQLGLGHDEDAHVFKPALCLPAESEQPIAFPPPGHFIAALASGANHAIAIVACSSDPSQRQVWASGSNAEAQLGSTISRDSLLHWTQLDLSSEPAAQQHLHCTSWRPTLVACGWNASFIALAGTDGEDDQLLSLGSSNDFGELGCGKNPAEQAVPSRLLSLSNGESSSSSRRAPLRIRRLASGVRHTCALVSRSEPDHDVWQLFGWGAARRGQIGAPSSTDQTGKRAESVRWLPECFATWHVPRPSSSEPASRDSEEAAVFLAAGKEHTMLAHPSDWRPVPERLCAQASHAFSVETWGSPSKGTCDLSSYMASPTATQEQHAQLLGADCTWNGTFACLGSPFGSLTVLSCGKNDKGQSGAGYFGDEPEQPSASTQANEMRRTRPDGTPGLVRRASLRQAASEHAQCKLVCGSEHVVLFAPDTAHAIWAWGWNEHGNLGTGSAEGEAELHDECSPREIWTPRHAGTRVQNVWAGCGTTFVQIIEAEL